MSFPPVPFRWDDAPVQTLIHDRHIASCWRAWFDEETIVELQAWPDGALHKKGLLHKNE
jgi:hypothetical protein